MGILAAITLIIMGILASPRIIVSRKPDAQQIIDKIVPFQGWIGIIGGLWGIWILIWTLRYAVLIRIVPLWWLTMLAMGIMFILLGFLLGYSLIAKAIAKSEEAAAKAAQLRTKLASLSGTLGIVAIVLALWSFIPRFIHF
jgi:hypothetical protein